MRCSSRCPQRVPDGGASRPTLPSARLAPQGEQWAQAATERPDLCGASGAGALSHTTPYGGSGKSALRSVALEIPISPVKGLSSSRTRKIAHANDSAQTSREAIMTRLARANKVKLTKI